MLGVRTFQLVPHFWLSRHHCCFSQTAPMAGAVCAPAGIRDRRIAPKEENLMMHRVLSVGLLAVGVAVFAFLPALSADDKTDIKDGTSFLGKISKIDTSKREL